MAGNRKVDESMRLKHLNGSQQSHLALSSEKPKITEVEWHLVGHLCCLTGVCDMPSYKENKFTVDQSSGSFSLPLASC